MQNTFVRGTKKQGGARARMWHLARVAEGRRVVHEAEPSPLVLVAELRARQEPRVFLQAALDQQGERTVVERVIWRKPGP